MATYYWVGGAGTWHTSTTTNWASSSGGAGGAGVPTSADDVIFDSASSAASYTVGISGASCKNLTATGPASGTLTFFSANNQQINCYGSVYISGNVATGSANGALNLRATTTGNTLSFNGVSVFNGGRIINVVGVGGEWTLTSNCASDILHTNGTLITNGYSLTSNITSAGTATRALTLGSSSISVATFTLSGSGLTLDAGSSTIVATGALTTTSTGSNNWGTSSITGGANSVIGPDTYYNVTLTGTSSITGASTFNNLTINGPASAGINTYTITSNQTVSGTLTFSASALTQRVALYSNTIGSAITFTVGTVSGLSNIDFRDITAAGSSSPWSTTSGCGDCGGNTNISNFPTAKTVYWNLTGSQNWSATAWATSSGGTPAAANFPLAQDTAIIDNTGAASTITYNGAFNVSAIDMSLRTSAMTFTGTAQINIYGNFKLGSGVSRTYTGTLYFAARSTVTVVTAGKAMNGALTVDCPGGGVQWGDAYTITTTNASYPITLLQGTLDTAGYSFTSAGSGIVTSGTGTKTLNLGSSTITIASNSASNPQWNVTASNLTFNAGTSSIALSLNSGGVTCALGTGATYYNLTITAASTSAPTGSAITCSSSFTQKDSRSYSFITTPNYYFNYSVMPTAFPAWTNATLQPTASGLVYTLAAGTYANITTSMTTAGVFTLSLSGDATITGTLTTNGTNETMRTIIQSNTAGTSRTITAAAVSLADVDFYFITGAGAATWSGVSIGNAGNNSGITFDAAKTVYWNLSGAQNINATGWATSSGGTPAVSNFPLPQDTAIFDNTGSVTGNITMIAGYYYPTLDMSARTNAMTLVTAVVNFAGGFKRGSGVTISGTSAFTFVGSNAAVIQCGGGTLANAITVAKYSGSLTQGDAFASSTSFTVTAGSYDAANYNLTALTFTSAGSVVRSVSMGSGTWTLTGGSTTWNTTTTTGFTFDAGASTLLFSGSSTQQMYPYAGQVFNNITIGGGANTTTFQIFGAIVANSLSSTRTAAYTIQLVGNLTVAGWNVNGSAGAAVTMSGNYQLIYTGNSYILTSYVNFPVGMSARPASYKWWYDPATSTTTVGRGFFPTPYFDPEQGAFAAFFIR